MPRAKTEKTITKSAKTGKMVSKVEAEANPDTTFEMKVKVTPKAITEVVAEVVDSKYYDYDGVVGRPSADGTVTLLRRQDGVQVTEIVEGMVGAPITDQEAYERAF
jgi:hypothetical protein